MRAPFRGAWKTRRLFRGDNAVQEVLGFILMFALSSIILIITMRTFTAAQENSEDLIAAVELKSIANRISSRIVQAGIVSQEFPEADFRVTLRIPEDIAGFRYSIRFRDRDDAWPVNDVNADPIVYLETTGSPGRGTETTITGEASLFRIEQVLVNAERIYLGTGEVLSSAGAVTVRYWYESDQTQGSNPAALEGHIELVGGTL